MGRKSVGLPQGVEIAGSSVRIRFTWKKERRCETLPYPQTPKGFAAAAGLRAQVTQLIKLGMLTDDKYAELFPSSRYTLARITPTFGHFAQLWLDSRQIVFNTRRNYLRVLNKYWMPHWATKRLDEILPVDVRVLMTKIEWNSATDRNAAVQAAKAIFEAATKDGVIAENPMRSVEKAREAERDIDPFTPAERDAILADLYGRLTGIRRSYASFFKLAFYTGLRTGEQLSLRWSDVDLANRTIRIRATLEKGKARDNTKTKRIRKVLLVDQAIEALEEMAELTRDWNEFVFAPTSGAKGNISNVVSTAYHLKQSMKRLGIRPRRQYDTRHTYATVCLSAGIAPAFIAQQLGNSIETLLKHYAKWISSSADWAELDKLKNS
ncbi:MAG: site-specific integrase [Pseudomonas sp.]|nr:site-specific integrase [Pseudomonas sp.]